MSIFVPSALAQPIALCLFDGKPATSGFISQSISTPVHVSDESTQALELLVMKLHSSAPIVLRLPWLRSTNPVIDWSTEFLDQPIVNPASNDSHHVMYNFSSLPQRYHFQSLSNVCFNS